MKLFLLAAASLLSVLCSVTLAGATLVVRDLRCEYRVDPVGLDVAQPRFSWTLASDQRGQRQTAYEMVVASSAETLAKDAGDLWSSGKVASDQTVHVAYAGKPLESRMRCFWKVRVWDKEGRPSPWSAPATWTMGLLNRTDWQSRWIADPNSAANVAAGSPINGYHSEFAQTADTTKWVVLDLGQPSGFDAVGLAPARPHDWQPDTPGFLFPVRFKIEAANHADFSDARVLVDRTEHDEPNPGKEAPVYRFPSTTARFVRLVVTRLKQRDHDRFAVALAEMQVLSGNSNLAQNAKVLALDSIEAGSWAKTGLSDGVTASAKPIGALPATMLRKSFHVGAQIKRATVYATACGLYELRLNGQRMGDQLLAPEWTDYRKRIQYQAFDVTRQLCRGENVLAASLGEGWYAGRLQFGSRYGSYPRFLMQLEVESADGTVQRIVTDESWRSTTDGPIRSAGIYDGESYDARKERAGWDATGFDDQQWNKVMTSDLDDAQLVWQRNEPIHVMRELKPLALTEPKPGVYVFDLGQNMVGWCRIRMHGTSGQPITMQFAEMLNDDGTVYRANLIRAAQTDTYIPSADGEVMFEPRFTYHGFRYVQLAGLVKPPTKDDLLGRVFHSSAPEAGTFSCSDSSLNQLMQNIVWTQRGNLMGVPTDCPQRGERMGWMGDIQAFAQTAMFNMDMAAFFTKFVQDIRDDQADDGRYPDFAPHPGNPNKGFSGVPAWGDAGTIVPWLAYQNYADVRLLEQHFDSARRWVDYIHKANPGLVWAKGRHNDYNDWLNGDWIKQKDWPDQGGAVPQEVFATAFFAHSTELVARMAEVLGRKEEARNYRELFNQIKAVFNQRFVKADGHMDGDTQGGYALALSFNLLPDPLRPQAAQRLVDNIQRYRNHLSTGIQTTHRAMLELTRYNHADLAWQLVTNRDFPSWLYMIDNGATTIWERWDGYVKGRGFQDAGMNSFNHWALGAVGEWLWRNVAGLNPDEARPGWKQFIIAPKPGGGVTWAHGEYDSIHGRIVSHWALEGSQLTMEVAIPANTTATVYVPARNAASVTEGAGPASAAEGLKFLRMEDGAVVFHVDSGKYRIQSLLANTVTETPKRESPVAGNER